MEEGKAVNEKSPLELLDEIFPEPTLSESHPLSRVLTVEEIAEKTGAMLQSKIPPTEAEAKAIFNSFVLDLALNRLTQKVSEAHRLLLRSCPDVVPTEILDNLGLPHGTVYAQAIASLCARGDAALVAKRKAAEIEQSEKEVA